MSREMLKLENEQRREFEVLEREMQRESPETGENWYDDRFGQTAYELGVKHGRAILVDIDRDAEIERLKAENCALIVAHGKELRNVTMRSANRTLRREIERLKEEIERLKEALDDKVTRVKFLEKYFMATLIRFVGDTEACRMWDNFYALEEK